MENYLGPGAEFNDLPDLYYVKERIPNWLGAARRKDADSTQVVMPINSTGLIRLAFALHATQRQQELIHFAMLRRLAPSLLAIPFAQQTWHPGLGDYGAPKRYSKTRFWLPGICHNMARGSIPSTKIQDLEPRL